MTPTKHLSRSHPWVFCEAIEQEEASTEANSRSRSLLEQMLRQLKGYDSYNTLLLPPRNPGEKLPQEVYDYFKEMKKSKEEYMKAKYLETLENGENSAWS